ncbi:MAG: outer membrane lipoprotein LolB [Burkholderiales bacterium]|nr:outer membrane lipoprotein LolB [Burkholderiales bacterium]
MKFGRSLAGVLLAISALVTGGCATPQRPAASAAEAASTWTGRLALQVQDRPQQSFTAAFELKGSAQAGELTLYSPLGSTMAQLAWAPGAATLRSGGQTRQFDSVDTLSAEATGTPIPLAALFDWLGGVATPVAGWQPDVSEVAQGRLRARRVDPPPVADLRLAFDR